MSEVARDDYTWAMAARDIALMTQLTVSEAVRWCSWTELNGIHPFDAAPLIANIVRALPDPRVGPGFFSNVAALMNLKEPKKT